MGDIHDADTDIEIPHPARRGFCSEHTEIVRICSETHALVKSQDARGNRMEHRLDTLDAKIDDYGNAIVGLRKDAQYHSKFWGAVAGTVVAAFWWLVARVTGQ